MSIMTAATAVGPGRTAEGATLTSELESLLNCVSVTSSGVSLTTVGTPAPTHLSRLVKTSATPSGVVSSAPGAMSTACVT